LAIGASSILRLVEAGAAYLSDMSAEDPCFGVLPSSCSFIPCVFCSNDMRWRCADGVPVVVDTALVVAGGIAAVHTCVEVAVRGTDQGEEAAL